MARLGSAGLLRADGPFAQAVQGGPGLAPHQRLGGVGGKVRQQTPDRRGARLLQSHYRPRRPPPRRSPAGPRPSGRDRPRQARVPDLARRTPAHRSPPGEISSPGAAGTILRHRLPTYLRVTGRGRVIPSRPPEQQLPL
jgi:hypothetical protein